VNQKGEFQVPFSDLGKKRTPLLERRGSSREVKTPTQHWARLFRVSRVGGGAKEGEIDKKEGPTDKTQKLFAVRS